VELAVVLVLIGLLLGLLLLGNGILVQSRIRFIANDFEQLKVAVLTYQDRYGALPGDDARAASRWVGRSKDGTGDGRISGSYQAPPPGGNPLVTLTVDALGGESLNFWWQLRLSELVNAPPPVITPVAQPLNATPSRGVEWGVFGFPRLAACTANCRERSRSASKASSTTGTAPRPGARRSRTSITSRSQPPMRRSTPSRPATQTCTRLPRLD
jgi:hypothetical protein